ARAAEENSSDRVTMFVLAKVGVASKIVRAVRGRAGAVSRFDRATVRDVPAATIAHRGRAKGEVVNSFDPERTGRIVLIDRTGRAKVAAANGGPAIGRTEFRTGTSGATGATIITTMCGTTGTTIGTTTGTTAITGSTTIGGTTTI